MKKYLLSMFLLPLCLAMAAQDKYGKGAMPFNEAGEVVFEEVVQQEGTADQLYSLAKMAMADMFVSAKHATQLNDEASHTVMVKGVNVIRELLANVDIHFSLKVQTKDGRYRVSFYDITYVAHLSNGLPDTRWNAEALTDKNCLNKKGECKKTGHGFARRCMIDTKDRLFSEIKAKMSSGEKSSNDW